MMAPRYLISPGACRVGAGGGAVRRSSMILDSELELPPKWSVYVSLYLIMVNNG